MRNPLQSDGVDWSLTRNVLLCGDDFNSLSDVLNDVLRGRRTKPPLHVVFAVIEKIRARGFPVFSLFHKLIYNDRNDVLAMILLLGWDPNVLNKWGSRLLDDGPLDTIHLLLAGGATATEMPSSLYTYVGDMHEEEDDNAEELRMMGRHNSHIIALLLANGAKTTPKDGWKGPSIGLRPEYCSLLERGMLMPVLLSPRLVPRLGSQSPLRWLPIEIVRLLARCLFHMPKHKLDTMTVWQAYARSEWWTLRDLLLHANDVKELENLLGEMILSLDNIAAPGPAAPLHVFIAMVNRLRALGSPPTRLVYQTTVYARLDYLGWLLLMGGDPNETVIYDGVPLPSLTFASIDAMYVLLAAGAKPVACVLYEFIDLHWFDREIRAGEHIKNGYRIALLLAHGANPYERIPYKPHMTSMQRVMKKDVPSMYIASLERAGILPILLSARMIPRVGEQSPLRLLASELIRLLYPYFGTCFSERDTHTTVLPENAGEDAVTTSSSGGAT